jgi:hypothetical protein
MNNASLVDFVEDVRHSSWIVSGDFFTRIQTIGAQLDQLGIYPDRGDDVIVETSFFRSFSNSAISPIGSNTRSESN